MIRMSFFPTAVLCFLLTSAQANEINAGSLKISDPWARATPKGATVGGGYMTITNTGSAPDRLVGGSSDISSRFEIHEMSTDNGVMKMRPIEKGLVIKAGETIQFKPGAYHLMFVGLNKPLEEGQHIKAVLEFEKAGKVSVDFSVLGIGAQTGGPSSNKMHMEHGR
jgi:periplasmic copper chaperone A